MVKAAKTKQPKLLSKSLVSLPRPDAAICDLNH